jgi:hypothetical protein
MNSQSRFSFFLPRVVMFTAMLVLILFATHYILPAGDDSGPDAVALNPVIQIGLFLTLTIFGGLIGFWITFGDLVNRGEKK